MIGYVKISRIGNTKDMAKGRMDYYKPPIISAYRIEGGIRQQQRSLVARVIDKSPLEKSHLPCWPGSETASRDGYREEPPSTQYRGVLIDHLCRAKDWETYRRTTLPASEPQRKV